MDFAIETHVVEWTALCKVTNTNHPRVRKHLNALPIRLTAEHTSISEVGLSQTVDVTTYILLNQPRKQTNNPGAWLTFDVTFSHGMRFTFNVKTNGVSCPTSLMEASNKLQ